MGAAPGGVTLSWLLLLLLACATEPPPAPLPPSALEVAAPIGRMARLGDLEGYIARPADDDPHPALLLWVGDLEGPTRERAMTEARSGQIVLAAPPLADAARSRAWLQGMRGATTVAERCLRPSCPDAPPTPAGP